MAPNYDYANPHYGPLTVGDMTYTFEGEVDPARVVHQHRKMAEVVGQTELIEVTRVLAYEGAKALNELLPRVKERMRYELANLVMTALSDGKRHAVRLMPIEEQAGGDYPFVKLVARALLTPLADEDEYEIAQGRG